MPKNDIILVTVRGHDAPGITARLTGEIAGVPSVKLLDIEQIIVHKKLILSLLIEFGKEGAGKGDLLKNLLLAAHELGVDLRTEVFDRSFFDVGKKGELYAVTCIGKEVNATALHKISKVLSRNRVNIDRISRLSLKRMAAVELIVSTTNGVVLSRLSQALLSLSRKLNIDISFQRHDLLRRAKRLIVMDVDATLIQNEIICDVAGVMGVRDEVRRVTDMAIHGEMNYEAGLKKRVAMFKGLPVSKLDRVWRGIKLNPGAARLIETLKKLGFKTAIASGGFTFFTDRLKKKLGLDHAFANELEVKDGLLTGRLKGRIVGVDEKARILKKLAKREGISLDQTIAIGDGANDLKMLSLAGLGIAFNAHENVRKNAPCSLSNTRNLDAILYLLGISDTEH